MKVKQLFCKKQSLGKYSKVVGYDESMVDETIEAMPEEKVAENPDTQALDILDVVELKNGEEVVVVDQPEPEDETIKVQSTETGVTADVPVEAFSKTIKVSKAKLRAYAAEALESVSDKVSEALADEIKQEVVENKQDEAVAAEAAKESTEAASVAQPAGTDTLPVSIKKVDNGYVVLVNGEEKVASDLAGVNAVIASAFSDTKMDAFSARRAAFNR